MKHSVTCKCYPINWELEERQQVFLCSCLDWDFIQLQLNLWKPERGSSTGCWHISKAIISLECMVEWNTCTWVFCCHFMWLCTNQQPCFELFLKWKMFYALCSISLSIQCALTCVAGAAFAVAQPAALVRWVVLVCRLSVNSAAHVSTVSMTLTEQRESVWAWQWMQCLVAGVQVSL